VIRDEALQARAQAVGGALKAGLEELKSRHQVIGDVRGMGLYLGVELVTDRESRAPAGAAAEYVANRMRERGILISTDGPDHNVLKIKPPLQFSADDGGALVECLDRVLAEEPLRVG
jgi:4-aminobutyrate aminotransferase-like enzyme